jgi:penicillin-binding protein 2
MKLGRRHFLVGALATAGCASAPPSPARASSRWRGTPLRYQRLLERAAGHPVELSVDARMQEATEAAVAHGGHAGAAVVVDVATGAIRAVHAVAGRTKDPLLTAYHPGSTFKTLMGAALLREGVMPEGLVCSGLFMDGGRRFMCPASHGPLDLDRAIVVSCNSYFFASARMLGMGKIAACARDFGLGAPAARDLRGALGEVRDDAEPLNVAVGHGNLLVTPLQLARAYLALANGGELVELTLDAARDGARKPLALERNHTNELRTALRSVVASPEGTAHAIDGPGLAIAGKTGTALNVGGKRDDGWFVGYAPADDPKVLALVLAEEGGSGAKSAAPVAREILAAATT